MLFCKVKANKAMSYFLAPRFCVFSAALPFSFVASPAVLRTILTSSILGMNCPSNFRPID